MAHRDKLEDVRVVLSDATWVKPGQAEITIDVVIPAFNEGVKSWTNAL